MRPWIKGCIHLLSNSDTNWLPFAPCDGRNSTASLKPSLFRTWSVPVNRCSSNYVSVWMASYPMCVFVCMCTQCCSASEPRPSSLYVHHTKWPLSAHASALSIHAHTFEAFSPPSGYCWRAGHGLESWSPRVCWARGSWPECWWYAHESTSTWGTERTRRHQINSTIVKQHFFLTALLKIHFSFNY